MYGTLMSLDLCCPFKPNLTHGKFWRHIRNLKDQERCSQCNAPTKSLEHILLQCTSIEMKTIWQLTCSLCPTSDISWPQLSLSLNYIILGCRAITPKPETPWKEDNNKSSTCMTPMHFNIRIHTPDLDNTMQMGHCRTTTYCRRDNYEMAKKTQHTS